MIWKTGTASALILLLTLTSSCSFNPFVPYNDTTGSAAGAVVGAGAGAGIAALAGGNKWWITGAGIAGGAIGYYVTTLRFESGAIIQAGGKAYQVGQTITIYIPTDSLFEPNTADFLPGTPQILDSVALVLNREPNNNIIISGDTSGFGRRNWELTLSERRAERISAYLWNQGVVPFKNASNESRRLTYVGYGDYFPIAGHWVNKAIRQNSRIQIVSYPASCVLKVDARQMTYNNVGSSDDNPILDAPRGGCRWDKYGNAMDCDA